MIDFSKTEEQELLIESIKELLEREMPAEKERECYRNGEFPWDAWKAMAEAGFTGLGLPEEVGGTDVDLMTVALANFTISRYGGPLAAFYSMGMPTMYDVCEFGTPEQIEKYVKPYIAGGAPLALGISEPSTGSDVLRVGRRHRGHQRRQALHHLRHGSSGHHRHRKGSDG